MGSTNKYAKEAASEFGESKKPRRAKANNRHAEGNGNGKFNKKKARIHAAEQREPRTFQERFETAGKREKARLLKTPEGKALAAANK